MGGIHLLLCTDHKEPPYIRSLHLVPKIGDMTVPTVHVPSQQIFSKPQLSTLCFCLILFHQWWWSTLQLLGLVFHRFNFTEMNLDSGFNSVLYVHQDIISLLSFALVQEQWCPSGQLFWTAHDARWCKRPWFRGEIVMDASCKNLFQSIISNTTKNLKWRHPPVFQRISFRLL